MSDMRPEGVELEFDGQERRVLFTLNAVDGIQDRLGVPIGDAIDMLTDPREAKAAYRVILTVLLNDEVERLDYKGVPHSLKPYTEKEVGWLVAETDKYRVLEAILKAYGVSLPEPEEDGFPNQGSARQKA